MADAIGLQVADATGLYDLADAIGLHDSADTSKTIARRADAFGLKAEPTKVKTFPYNLPSAFSGILVTTRFGGIPW